MNRKQEVSIFPSQKICGCCVWVFACAQMSCIGYFMATIKCTSCVYVVGAVDCVTIWIDYTQVYFIHIETTHRLCNFLWINQIRLCMMFSSVRIETRINWTKSTFVNMQSVDMEKNFVENIFMRFHTKDNTQMIFFHCRCWHRNCDLLCLYLFMSWANDLPLSSTVNRVCVPFLCVLLNRCLCQFLFLSLSHSHSRLLLDLSFSIWTFNLILQEAAALRENEKKV